MKILLKTLDAAAPTPERIEMSVVQRDDNGNVVHRMLTDEEVQVLLTLVQKENDAEAKTAEASSGNI